MKLSSIGFLLFISINMIVDFFVIFGFEYTIDQKLGIIKLLLFLGIGSIYLKLDEGNI